MKEKCFSNFPVTLKRGDGIYVQNKRTKLRSDQIKTSNSYLYYLSDALVIVIKTGRSSKLDFNILSTAQGCIRISGMGQSTSSIKVILMQTFNSMWDLKDLTLLSMRKAMLIVMDECWTLYRHRLASCIIFHTSKWVQTVLLQEKGRLTIRAKARLLRIQYWDYSQLLHHSFREEHR